MQVASKLERMSEQYEGAEQAFLDAVRDDEDRASLARTAREAATAASAFQAESYRKLFAGEEDAWMPLSDLTERLGEVDARAQRADEARNRGTLLVAATRVFATSGTEPSMRAIAREAGVGIATLYRHFPTRKVLVDAVYEDQVQRLTVGARELLRQLPPAEAMRRWMDLFADWLATKHGMTDTLLAMIDTGEINLAHTRTELLGAISMILDAGTAAGDIRADVSADDIAASLLGISTVAGKPQQHTQAGRLLDLLMDGLRPAASSLTRGSGHLGEPGSVRPSGT